MQFLSYLLVFAFGYLTCKAIYFLRSSRLSLQTIKMSHLIYLSVIMKSIENLTTSRELLLEYLLRTNKSSNYITSFTINFDKQIKNIKQESIRSLIDIHPDFFKPFVEFEDWESSMVYLEKYKKSSNNFWRKT